MGIEDTPTPAGLLVEYLSERGFKTDGDRVFNGAFWSAIVDREDGNMSVGCLVLNPADPRSFIQAIVHLENCDRDAKIFMYEVNKRTGAN